MEGLDVGSVVFSYSIFLTLYFCFRSFSPARSHLHLTFWLQSGEEGSYHTGSHYLIISLSRRGEEIAGGDFFSTRCVKTVLLCFSSYFFFYSSCTFSRLAVHPAPQWSCSAQNILSTPILFAVGCHTDRPNISSHKSVSSLQRFLAGLVSSNPTVSLAKRWLGMTLERLTDGPVATGNQQQHKYSMGKASATPKRY